MMPFEFHMPTRILFGPGVVQRVADEVRPFSRRALLVTMADLPFVVRVVNLLQRGGINVTVFDECEPNPEAKTCDRAAALACEKGCGVFVGLGGGSAMDTAKGAAVSAAHKSPAWEFTIEWAEEPREATSSTFPIVAIPTTAGTGSEVSRVAVLSNHETKQKGPIRSPYIYPRTALIDPELTLSMPPELTAATGFDALSHALERYLSTARHSMIDLLAEDAIRTVIQNLKRVVDSGQDLQARSKMMWASTQATTCIGARLNELGLHIFGLPLSAHLGTAHGVSLAVLVPFLLRDAAPHFPEKCARLAELLAPDVRGINCAHAMRRWLSEVGLRFSLRDLGVSAELCPRLAQSVNLQRFANTFYKEKTRADVEKFYRDALMGSLPDSTQAEASYSV
jgi:alcohol dehydrogenase class IV